MGLPWGLQIITKSRKICMSTYWEVIWNKQTNKKPILHHREKQLSNSLSLLSTSHLTSTPASLIKCWATHKGKRIILFIPLRKMTITYCLVPQIAFLQQPSPRTVVLSCSTGLQENNLSLLCSNHDLSHWDYYSSMRKQSILFNYTPFLWMMPASQCYSVNYIGDLLVRIHSTGVCVCVCVYILFILVETALETIFLQVCL